MTDNIRLGVVEKTTEETKKAVFEIKTALIGDLNNRGLITEHKEMYGDFKGRQDQKRWIFRTVVGGILLAIIGLVIYKAKTGFGGI